jgi:hypothetical protein
MISPNETAFVDDEVIVCQICGSTPCEWAEFGDEVKDYSKILYIHKAMNGMIAMTESIVQNIYIFEIWASWSRK